MLLVCAGNFARAQASGADVHSGVSSVNNGSYLAHVRLPHSVGSTMGVGNVLSEDDALSANITLCHLKTPPVSAIRNIYFLLFFKTRIVLYHIVSKKARVF